ncbi:MAG: Rieske 2Fe-2S domain-containing protein [Bdellovibrionota bacterium]
MPFFKVCPTNEISKSQLKKISLNGSDILITQSSDERYWAFDATCTHADKPLEKGKWNPETMELTCPFHKAVFAISEKGAVKAPPAFVALNVYNVETRIENELAYIFLEMEG